MFEIEGIEIILKNLNRLLYKMEDGKKEKIIAFSEGKLVVRNGRERATISNYSYLNLQTEKKETLLLSDLVNHISEIKVKGEDIKMKSLSRSLKLRYTKGQKKLEEKYGLNIEKELSRLEGLKIISKIKANWLAVLLNSIQIMVNMHGSNHGEKCQPCEKEDETMEHLFKKCKNAKRVIKFEKFSEVKKLNWNDTSVSDKTLRVILLRNFIIWKTRCELVIGGKRKTNQEIEKDIENIFFRQKVNKW